MLDRLPEDIVRRLGHYLDDRERFTVASTSKYMQRVFCRARLHVELLYNRRTCFTCKETLFSHQSLTESLGISSFARNITDAKGTRSTSACAQGEKRKLLPSAVVFWQNDRTGIPENLLLEGMRRLSTEGQRLQCQRSEHGGRPRRYLEEEPKMHSRGNDKPAASTKLLCY